MLVSYFLKKVFMKMELFVTNVIISVLNANKMVILAYSVLILIELNKTIIVNVKMVFMKY